VLGPAPASTVPLVPLDTTFDLRTDAGGKDPDQHSATLRRYHRLLWSKPLPSGASFDLDDSSPGVYLHHKSALGEFVLGSDSVVPSFTRWKSMAALMSGFPEEEHEAFRTAGYTIGGMMVFPSNRVDGKATLNGARGFNRRIADRMDLTLECIRRHYRGEDHPLAEAVERYADFFTLFGDFRGYVDHFLLQDIVDDEEVRFFTPFDEFRSPSVPENAEAYREYRRLSIEWIDARNRRIAALPFP
jgi:hypothetical protein